MNASLPTVVIEFVAAHQEDVEAALRTLGATNALGAVLDAPPSPLEGDDKQFRNRYVHFMSLVVVPALENESSAYLLIEINADGRPEVVLDRLAHDLYGELNAVLSAAWVAQTSVSDLSAFLQAKCKDFRPGIGHRSGLLFCGTPDLTVQRIKSEEWFAKVIRTELLAKLDEAGGLKGSALGILRVARRKVFEDPKLKWAFVAEPIDRIVGEAKPVEWSSLVRAAVRDALWPLAIAPYFAFLYCRLWNHHDIIDSLLHAAVWFVGVNTLLVLGILFGYRSLRRDEDEDVPIDAEPKKEDIAEIRKYEDRQVQNHLAAVSAMKPGWYRGIALRVALWVIGESGVRRSQPGFIDKIGSIHFARWIRIPGTRKLVFLSNYDGSWQSYLEDFIARLREGLSSVWSNTKDFPKTEMLTKGGAGDGTRFKRWARRQQRASSCWYSAYPGLTTHRIRANARIRHGFASAATEDEAADWLSLFGYATRESLEFREIPTLVFGGMRRLPHARGFVLKFPGSALAARRWIGKIENDIIYGDRAPETSGLVIALTAEGLGKLGIEGAALATFPMAFQEGMGGRAGALGDPAGKAWDADALLLVYAKDQDALADAVTAVRNAIETDGGKPVPAEDQVQVQEEIFTDVLGDEISEPFGFRDGISQPLMRGTFRGSRDPNPLSVVEAGELVLGYRDNLQTTAPFPYVRGQEFGRNGSYLVVRKLKQDVAGFNAYLKTTADTLRGTGDPRVPCASPHLEEWVGAKMVGRWRNGTSLVRYPHKPGTAGGREEVPGQDMRLRGDAPEPESIATPGRTATTAKEIVPDNTFLFGREDPDGLRCPFGAHIRRANPRDSFEPGSQKQLDISNRHRILRVGRAFVDPPKDKQDPASKPGPAGLLFMCVQSDIERQFEFLQQSWIMGRDFHGLVDEADPICGAGRDRIMTVPTSNGPLRLRALSEFVSLEGGAYFFMPGRTAVRMLALGSEGMAVSYEVPGTVASLDMPGVDAAPPDDGR